MKKRAKKLVLAKETMRNLDVRPLRAAAGGWTTPLDGCTNTTAGCPYTANGTCDCGYTTGMETAVCNSNQVACPITAGETCLAC
jgi:hypothetical protein